MTCRDRTCVSSGKGTLSLAEVIERLLPPDYTAPSWNILRDMEATKKQEAEAKSQFMPYGVVWCAWGRTTLSTAVQCAQVSSHST